MKYAGQSLSRRQFLRRAAWLGAAALPASRALGANGDIRVAIIGLGGKGSQHVGAFKDMSGVRVAALCDVDPQRLAEQVKRFTDGGAAPFAATDPRRILDRADVDAAVIATPNHWHALLGVWAMQAGKDVYVEKPVSHNVWEGAQLVAAAKAHGRIVQGGTQYRSDPGLRAAGEWLREGHLGRLRSAHVVWFELRGGIGKADPWTPDTLDYDLYCGPAPVEPLTRPRLHYDWHWVWSTGDGDLGNSGIHAFDACRMLTNVSGWPRRVMALGGRFAFDDAGQTPNTQLTLLDYPEVPILIDNRNLAMLPEAKAMDRFRGIREGVVLQYEGGYFSGLRSGGNAFNNDGRPIREFPGDGGGQHQANFIAAVRSRKTEDLCAPVEETHMSSAACHLGNISYRLGKRAPKRDCLQAVGEHPDAAEAIDRIESNLSANGVRLDANPFTLGPWLEIEHGVGGITSVTGGDAGALESASRLARGTDRKPYNFPADM